MWKVKSSLEDNDNYISTGCPNMDLFLRGGFYRRGVTQIYGESGVGKTQLALQLCLAAQIPTGNLNDTGGAAYICTEAIFPSSRLHELLQKSVLIKKHCISNDMIFIEHVSNTEDLENCILNYKRLPHLLSKYNIKLLVIDSVAATYRIEYDKNNLKNRASSFRNLGYHLQNLACYYKTAVICINQISANVKNSCLDMCFENQPSLGITWASMITNSLCMYKKYNRRYMSIKGSSFLPCKTVEYDIFDYGIIAKNV